MGNTHGLTHDELSLPEAMDGQAGRMVHREVDQRHWRQEGKHHGCRGAGSQTFGAGYVPGVLTAREADLPWEHRLHQDPHHGEHGPRRTPFRCFPPPWPPGSRMLAPAHARCHRGMVLLIRLEDLGSWTRCGPPGGGQDGPPVRLLGGAQGR